MNNGGVNTYYQMGGIGGGKTSASGNGNYGGYMSLWTTSGGANGEANSGMYERMRIDAAGNVGIGTTSPGAKLHVEVATAGDAALILQDDTGSRFEFQAGISGVTGDALAIKDTSIGYDYLTLRSGNVGIGTTSPENLLHVQQSGLYTGSHTSAGIRIKSDGASASGNYHGAISLSKGTGSVAIAAVQEDADNDIMGLAFFTHPSSTGTDLAVEKMRIDSAGNITKTPTTGSGTLDIMGSESISHSGSSGTFTRSFNPVDLWGFSATGGMVRLEVSGWSQRVNCGYIQFQNAGGSGTLTNVIYTQIALVGSGQISVSINSANDNTIDITFTGWHSNGHAWRCRIHPV
jgi:hypothetical protein